MSTTRGEQGESLVPEAAMEALTRTLTMVDDHRSHLLQFLSMAEPDVIAELHPLQRARAFLLLAKSASAFLSVRLRCNGIDPDDHAIKSELERLSLYEDKLQHFDAWIKAPLRPSTTLNCQAATRFIQHSLPDLTTEQRRSMQKISRGEGKSIHEEKRARKKRKNQASQQQSSRAAAQEFLEKAARELLGSNDSGVKGPLREETSDEGDDQ